MISNEMRDFQRDTKLKSLGTLSVRLGSRFSATLYKVDSIMEFMYYPYYLSLMDYTLYLH